MLRERKADIFGLAIVVAMWLKMVWALEGTRGIGLNDETLYMASGVRLFHAGYPNNAWGLPPAAWGPLYSFWYAIEHIFVRDLVHLYFFNLSVLTLFVLVAVYVLARQLSGPVMALAATFLLAVSRLFEVWPHQSYFAALALLVGATLALRAPEFRVAARRVVMTLLVTSYIRPEFFVMFLAAVVVWMVAGWRRLLIRELAADAAKIGAVCAIPLLVLGAPFDSGRTFFAFGQHYALNKHDSSTDWYPVVEHDFGKVASVSQAARARPGAFARHIGRNLLATPAAVWQTMEPAGQGIPRNLILPLCYLALLGFGIFTARKRIRAEPRLLALVALVGAAGIATLAGVLLIHPRLHYFVPLMALGVATLIPMLPIPKRVPLAAVAAVCLATVPNPAHGWTLQSLLSHPNPPPDRQVEAGIAALRALDIHQPVFVLEHDWGYAFYANLDFQRVSELEKDAPFDEYVRAHDVNLMILSDRFVQADPRYGGDPQYASFLDHPEVMGFRLLDVPNTTLRIAVRSDVATR